MKILAFLKRKWKDILIAIAIPATALLVFSFPSITQQGSIGTYYKDEEHANAKIESFSLSGWGTGTIYFNEGDKVVPYPCTWYARLGGSEIGSFNLVWEKGQTQFDFHKLGVLSDQSTGVIYTKA